MIFGAVVISATIAFLIGFIIGNTWQNGRTRHFERLQEEKRSLVKEVRKLRSTCGEYWKLGETIRGSESLHHAWKDIELLAGLEGKDITLKDQRY
jgi:hypothetical protein